MRSIVATTSIYDRKAAFDRKYIQKITAPLTITIGDYNNDNDTWRLASNYDKKTILDRELQKLSSIAQSSAAAKTRLKYNNFCSVDNNVTTNNYMNTAHKYTVSCIMLGTR